LAEGGLIVAEQASTETPPQIKGLDLVKLKKYKTTTFIFYRRYNKVEEEL
jgi:16S rRNA G966 N2-methylase RsmD